MLREPFAHEDIGTSTPPLIAVDLTAAPASGSAPQRDSDDLVIDDLVRKLAEVPAVTVGVLPHPQTSTGQTGSGSDLGRLYRAFDLLVTQNADDAATKRTDATDATDRVGWVGFRDRDASDLLEEIVAAVTASPQAAVTLVQLLRLSEHTSVRDALVAESLAYATLQGGATFRSWLRDRSTPSQPAVEIDPPPAVTVEIDGPSMHLALNRPHRHNAFSVAVRDELVTALRTAAADPSIEKIILSGNGPSFCAGGDLTEFGTAPDAATGHVIRSIRSPAWWMHTLADQTNVRLHGACIGAGIELAAFSGSITSHRDAYFQLPEVSMGLIPGAGGTVSLPRRIGRQRTAWLAITSSRVDAACAFRWRLVDELLTE